MASLNAARIELTRRANNGIRSWVTSRSLWSSSRAMAAQVYAMPAMSPTMTEGNISKWNVKEGESFSAGDVLLEIETDKASMDVEAQDDGILAKIMQPDGSKGIKVGKTIAVLADPDDDLSSLEMPTEEESATSYKQDKQATEVEQTKEISQQPAENEPTSDAGGPRNLLGSSQGQVHKQTYPLYPSVIQILHENGLDNSEADKIPATGPNGRLLKGDVLAYLGVIKPSYAAEQSERISQLGHLDLSNIKIVPAKPPNTPGDKVEDSPIFEEEPDTEIAVTISLKAARDVQQRIQRTLQIDIPLETFVARAIEISNTDLPASDKPPTADELFNDVLGLANVNSTTSNGSFVPQITALPTASEFASTLPTKRPDIIDILGSTPLQKAVHSANTSDIMTGGDGTKVFCVTAAKADEKRARVFLERVKTILQVDPGRLVL